MGTKNTDGTRMQAHPDGTTVEFLADGSEKQTFPDGTVLITRADGSQFQMDPTGLVIEQNDDAVVQVNPNGVIHELRADGTRVTANTDGTAVELLPDGTRIKKRFGQVIDTDAHNDDIAVAATSGELNLDGKNNIELRQICKDLGIPAKTWDPKKLQELIRNHMQK